MLLLKYSARVAAFVVSPFVMPAYLAVARVQAGEREEQGDWQLTYSQMCRLSVLQNSYDAYSKSCT